MDRVGWYRLVSSDIDEDDEDSVPDSPPLNVVVPDSLDPDRFGMYVPETEFQEPDFFVPSTRKFDVVTDVDGGCRSDGKSVEEVDSKPLSPSTVKFWKYAERFQEQIKKRKRVDDGGMSSGKSPEDNDRLPEQLPETRSSFRMRQLEERCYARLKKSSK